MRKFLDYVYLQFEKGNFDNFGDETYIKQYQFSPSELERIKYNSGRVVSGTKEQVKEQLTQLAHDFDVDEIIVATMANNVALRRKSFQLLSEAFELNTK